MSFDGQLLKRGFWLYVWDIRAPSGQYIYVGRTGDNSSPNAASPFRRAGAHLELKPSAKGNALARQLRREGIEPTECHFEMVAIGPIFEEEQDMEAHKPVRNKVGALEHALAEWLRGRDYQVLGTHQKMAPLDERLLDQVTEIIDRHLSPRESK